MLTPGRKRARWASVICDWIVQETASADNGIQANAAQATNTRVTIGSFEETRINGIGWVRPCICECVPCCARSPARNCSHVTTDTIMANETKPLLVYT